MLIGNVGKEPELRYTPSGIPVANFMIATSESWKEKDGSVCEHTDWHNISAWRGLAEVAGKIIQKGTRVYVEGKIHTRTIDGKNGGKKFIIDIIADNILLLDNRKNHRESTDDFRKSDFSFDDEIFENDLDMDLMSTMNTDDNHNCNENNFNNDELLY
jgi:single stranded DNA-binding protein